MIVIILCGSHSVSQEFGSRGLQWSTQESHAFQDYVIRTLNSQDRLINEYWLHYWLQQKIQLLQFNSALELPRLYPINVNDNSVNAFAMPGNVIGFHKGLWQFAENEDEFLSVLAHEIAHIALNHFSRLQDNRAESTMVIAGGILASILIANSDPEVANATLISSLAAANQQGLRFSQAMELEADQMARELLENAGYAPNSARTFFLRLQQQSASGGVYEFLRTHPLGTTRAARIEPSSNPLPEGPTDFDWLRFAQFNIHHPDIESLLATGTPITDQGAWPWLISAEQLFKGSQPNRYRAEVDSLLSQYPSFLPAKVERLSLALTSDIETCSLWENNTIAWETAQLTLDVIETITEVLKQCDQSYALEWRVKQVWQSGQSIQALNLLSQQLRVASSENESARLRALYDQYQGLYQRYR